jgi:hypothetical protein
MLDMNVGELLLQNKQIKSLRAIQIDSIMLGICFLLLMHLQKKKFLTNFIGLEQIIITNYVRKKCYVCRTRRFIL